MAKVKKRIKTTGKKYNSPFQNYWTSMNYRLLAAGIIILIIGYILMAQGPWDNPLSLSIAPIVLLIAYLIIFPLSIMYKKKADNSNKSETH